mmetsp:Transcript_11339/g.17544  ORF Transcript_11339/g.17544 Transcript_11339/m.17544 type:complete len:402 (+) Transcript_11339:150-1355(+)
MSDQRKNVVQTGSIDKPSKTLDKTLSGDTVQSMQFSPLDVAKFASGTIEKICTTSRIIVPDPFANSSIIKIQRKEFEVGELVGEGSFSSVYEIARFRATSKFVDEVNDGENQEKKFVIKHLASDQCRNESDLMHTASDLAKEAFLLASMGEHPHILRLRGISSSGIAGFGNGRPDGFFLIFEKLTDTLFQRIQAWKASEQCTLNIFKSSKSTQAIQFMAERLKIGADLASAIEYLHDHNIMHRDIKPDNIGFDSQGNIKLFDFGIFKEILEGSDNEPYELTGQVGSFRYMAPEVATSRPYTLKADVYSFTMVIWQMLTLVRPFERLRPDAFKAGVFMENKRPKINKKWPRELQVFLGEGWSPNPKERPTIKQALLILREQSNLLISNTKGAKDRRGKFRGS